MKIAMVSEHASPLAALGGVDAGGQNVHVAALADALARRGHQITVYTRREDPTVAERVSGSPGVEVVHVPAGPPTVLPKDELLPVHDRVRRLDGGGLGPAGTARRRPRPLLDVRAGGGASRPHLSRPAGPDLPRPRLGQTAPPGRRGHQPREPGRARATPLSHTSTWCSPPAATRSASSPRSGPARTGYGSSPAAWTPTSSPPPPTPANRRPMPHRLLAVGRLVPRKGYDRIVSALPELPGAELRHRRWSTRATGSPTTEARPAAGRPRRRAGGRRPGAPGRRRRAGRDAGPDPVGGGRAHHCPGTSRSASPRSRRRPARARSSPPLWAGSGDTVVDGVTGRLLTSTDPASIAAAVQPLLDAPLLAQRWGAAARRRAVPRYEWTTVAAETERALEHLVSAGPGRHRSTSSTRSEAVWTR